MVISNFCSQMSHPALVPSPNNNYLYFLIISTNLTHFLTFLFIARTAPAQGNKVSVITFGSHEGSSKQGPEKSKETDITPQPSTSQTSGNYEVEG